MITEEKENYYKRKYKTLRERHKLARNRTRKLRLNPTRYENILKSKLNKAGYKYVFQKAIYNEWYFCIVDFSLVGRKLIIEVDGQHHIENIDQLKKDYGHEKFLSSIGYKVVRLLNSEVEKITVKQLKKIVEENSKLLSRK